MDYTIYYILGGLAIIYVFFSMKNRRTAKRRKSRGFMEGYERKDKDRKENEK
ncbi:MAG: hypothetical protein KJN76_14430 [Eudoraea sp.]|nr:hypothetical protein [Eudoraea sp.]